ncbi:hypothetical protein JG687_00017056, partial [Phytophthora cactorum]
VEPTGEGTTWQLRALNTPPRKGDDHPGPRHEEVRLVVCLPQPQWSQTPVPRSPNPLVTSVYHLSTHRVLFVFSDPPCKSVYSELGETGHAEPQNPTRKISCFTSPSPR